MNLRNIAFRPVRPTLKPVTTSVPSFAIICQCGGYLTSATEALRCMQIHELTPTGRCGLSSY
jgi:hypothetical protein